jgi:hypothetical protein
MQASLTITTYFQKMGLNAIAAAATMDLQHYFKWGVSGSCSPYNDDGEVSRNPIFSPPVTVAMRL